MTLAKDEAGGAHEEPGGGDKLRPGLHWVQSASGCVRQSRIWPSSIPRFLLRPPTSPFFPALKTQCHPRYLPNHLKPSSSCCVGWPFSCDNDPREAMASRMSPRSDVAASPALESSASMPRPISSMEPTPLAPEYVKLEDSPTPSGYTDIATPDAPSTASAGRKRKLNSTSARGVANLTPEQLAKKRANDRQAQRAIRERTKAHIDSLEQRVQELSSQKPFLDLQAALKQNEAIQAENREIRQALKAVMDIIQPLVGKPSESCNSKAPGRIPVGGQVGKLTSSGVPSCHSQCSCDSSHHAQGPFAFSNPELLREQPLPSKGPSLRQYLYGVHSERRDSLLHPFRARAGRHNLPSAGRLEFGHVVPNCLRLSAT